MSAPALYVKPTCPHCLKLRLFLLEAGLDGTATICAVEAGSDAEARVRSELSAHLDRVTFPALRTPEGGYMTESDAIIGWFAERFGVDEAALPLHRAYSGHVLPRYMACRSELAAFRERDQGLLRDR